MKIVSIFILIVAFAFIVWLTYLLYKEMVEIYNYIVEIKTDEEMKKGSDKKWNIIRYKNIQIYT